MEVTPAVRLSPNATILLIPRVGTTLTVREQRAVC